MSNKKSEYNHFSKGTLVGSNSQIPKSSNSQIILRSNFQILKSSNSQITL